MQDNDSGAEDLSVELKRKLEEAERDVDRERERADSLMREHQSLRDELTALRKQLDGEAQTHAKTRQSHDLLQGKATTLEAAVAEHKREAQRQSQRADQGGRDLDTAKREVIGLQSRLRAAEEQLATLTAAASELAAARVQMATADEQRKALELELAVVQQRAATDQTTALEASERAEALRKDAAVFEERLAQVKKALAAEAAAHEETRRKLEVQREAAAEARRKGQRKLAGVIGGTAIALVALLRRRG